MKPRTLIFCALFLLVLFGVSSGAWACPTCKEGISEGANHVNVVRGYFWSILFMMSMPFLIFGGLGTYFYVQILRARAANASAGLPIGAACVD